MGSKNQRRKERREAGGWAPRREPAARLDSAARLEGWLSARREKAFAILLLLAMALTRFLLLLENGGRFVRSADSAFFIEMGKRIAAGDVFLKGESLIFSPLYYYFLGAVFALFGENYWWVLTIQFLLGITGGFLLYLLAREMFGPLSALVTLTLYAFYGLTLLYEGQVLDASFSTLLPIGFLYLLRRAPGFGRIPYWFAGGAVLGLFALTRPNVMLFFPLAAVWALLAARHKWPVQRRLACLAGLVLGIACCILPFTVRNWLVMGELAAITTHGGINFYLGNNEKATGFFTPPPEWPPISGIFNREVPRLAAERESGRTGMSDTEVSSYWFRRGIESIRRRPGRFMRLTLVKAIAFFNGFEVPVNTEYSLLRDIFRSLRIAFIPLGVVMPLGLMGMALAIPAWRAHLIIYLYFLSYTASVILFFITARYRLPIVPVLLLYAGFTVTALLANLGRLTRLAGLAMALALLFALVNINLGIKVDPATAAHSQGSILEGLGRLEQAAARYEEALRMDPRLIGSHTAAARVYSQLGDIAKANQHIKAALRLAPDNAGLREEARRLREK